ncbi:DUF4186 domain-containing protein [Methylomonas sp. SURF-2]|uniref:DUF4186 domain-containing protein n=1 Tax=Methylomonas subterranea TaxID=2952225 RepID=A0ABT1TJ84_9GAMM|nr:DUF4186 domain-containing protein [Methylomonas sp. SURF-2]MCQ8105535.1 DUF4186 domain-containing protein [Methylomonas sp. SURF-2]
MRDLEQLFAALGKSAFRGKFHLRAGDMQYLRAKGLPTMRRHARDFVGKRLAPALIPNDGKQTPYRGHPVFVAQHATACCCRSCLHKWHGIEQGRMLTEQEQHYIVEVLLRWFQREMRGLADS